MRKSFPVPKSLEKHEPDYPFPTGPGEWVRNSIAHQRDRVIECLAQGEPEFEQVWPAGMRSLCYDANVAYVDVKTIYGS